VIAAVPPKVTRSVNFWPAVKVTVGFASVTVRPEPPVMVVDNVTGPANPAMFTPAEAPEGRLPIVSISVAELPDANVRAGPTGVPFEVVMLKLCGRTLTVMV